MYALGQRTAVPAADRVVRLDHNAAPYRDAVVEALENLEKALQQANDYPDAEDKDQKIAAGIFAASQILSGR